MSDKKIILDIETTGLDVKKDRIICFNGMIVDENHYIISEKHINILPDGDWNISLGAYLSHKIKPSDLDGCPHFSDIANDILEFIGYGDMDIITYNGIRCDMLFLKSEFIRCGIEWSPMKYHIYDIMVEDIIRYNYSLEKMYERYEGKKMEESKLTKDNDYSNLLATYRIFYKQQKKKKYEPIEIISDDNFVNKMEVTSMVSNEKMMAICFTSGKYKNVPISWVYMSDPSYISWCLSSNIDNTSKDIIREEIKSIIR